MVLCLWPVPVWLAIVLYEKLVYGEFIFQIGKEVSKAMTPRDFVLLRPIDEHSPDDLLEKKYPGYQGRQPGETRFRHIEGGWAEPNPAERRLLRQSLKD
jgi:hypothetical protein